MLRHLGQESHEPAGTDCANGGDSAERGPGARRPHRRAARQPRHAGQDDAASVRRYLKEFLSDARVIENQGPIWKFVLNVI